MAIGDLKISGDGRRGDDGKDGKGYQGHAREPGVAGLNGEDGTSPTDGGDAQIVHVFLKRVQPGTSAPQLIVNVDQHGDPCEEVLPHSELKEEFSHDLGSEGNITITACGGAGGRGGSGGHGQGGGNGRDGENATADRSGTDGGPGGNGGIAGDGTSGANAGKAGEIKLFIKEEDMDLLLAVSSLDVQGGRGGKAGVNGSPGPGGLGGRGGASYTARTTTHTEGVTREVTHHNIGGKSGPGGQTGAPSRAVLVDGGNGADGEVHIFVQKPDGQLAGPFDSSYKLEVVEFDIVDGNEDEILEFGEEIVLRNIRVQNSGSITIHCSLIVGGAPSPSASQVTMEGESTEWLIAPRTTHMVPKSILNGATVRIDGRFTFKVKRPRGVPVGKPFSVEDAFKLRGHMSGIDRDVPGFHSPRRITLQHPIEMTKPRFLHCLTLGQEAVFSWKVQNKSTKDLGADSASHRQIKFAITQTGESALKFGPSNLDDLEHPINLLPTRGSKDIEMIVKVPLKAVPYMRTEAHISLLFTPPDNSEPCAIQTYDLPIQVSNTFRYDPEAKFLLVTNIETSADDVESWYQLICNRFGMKMDVWNVSVNGHLELLGGARNTERQSLFQLYKGKTIIILGNSFPYFDRGQRAAMNLVDPKDFAPAALGGTNLFISAMDVDKSQPFQLTRLLRTSSYPESREFTTVKELVNAIVLERHETNFYNIQYVCLPTKRGDNSQRCSSKANRAASELLRRLPSHRFMISWTSAEALERTVNSAGRVEVKPCTPYDRSKFIVTRSVSAARTDEMNEFGVLLSLPFTTKLEMLWNEFGENRPAPRKGYPQGILEIVKVDMVTELARFVNPSPPWPDSIEKAEVLSHLPRLKEFFTYNTSRAFSQESVERVVETLGDLRLLADCCPGSSPRQVTFSTRRKNIWSELLNQIDVFIKSHFGKEGKAVNAAYLKYVIEKSAQTVSESHLGRKSKIVQRVVANVPVHVGMDFSDSTVGVVDFEMLGNIVGSQTDAKAWKQIDWSAATQLEGDLAHAKEQVTDDMSRLPGYSA